MPVSVIHVIGALVAGGAERFVVSLVKALASRDLPVELIVLSSRTDAAGAAMRGELDRAGIPVAVGPTERVGARTVAWYTRQLRARPAAHVHLHTPNTELMHWLAARPAGARRPVFRTVHNTAPVDGLLPRLACQRNEAACSIACSTAVLDAGRARFPQPFVAIRNGIEFPTPPRDQQAAHAARRHFGLEPDATHFVAIGRMGGRTLATAQKAHDLLLRAWRRGAIGRRGGRLHLLGDGPLRPALERMASDDPTIRFHGTTPEVPHWLSAADVFVMPSRHEGLPIAGIEAVGAGLPAVFSDIAPLRELEAPAALHVPVDDEAALAAALQSRVAAVPAVDAAAVAAFRARFSIDRTASLYRDVYARFA